MRSQADDDLTSDRTETTNTCAADAAVAANVGVPPDLGLVESGATVNEVASAERASTRRLRGWE